VDSSTRLPPTPHLQASGMDGAKRVFSAGPPEGAGILKHRRVDTPVECVEHLGRTATALYAWRTRFGYAHCGIGHCPCLAHRAQRCLPRTRSVLTGPGVTCYHLQAKHTAHYARHWLVWTCLWQRERWPHTHQTTTAHARRTARVHAVLHWVLLLRHEPRQTWRQHRSTPTARPGSHTLPTPTITRRHAALYGALLAPACLSPPRTNAHRTCFSRATRMRWFWFVVGADAPPPPTHTFPTTHRPLNTFWSLLARSSTGDQWPQLDRRFSGHILRDSSGGRARTATTASSTGCHGIYHHTYARTTVGVVVVFHACHLRALVPARALRLCLRFHLAAPAFPTLLTLREHIPRTGSRKAAAARYRAAPRTRGFPISLARLE